MVPSSLKRFLALILLAFSQAKTSAETITPKNTATAKSTKTVTAETKIKTKASDFGIFFRILKLDQAKVSITIINITPTNAAIGTISMYLSAKRIKVNSVNAIITPDKRPLPPALILITVCPIIPQPPVPPKRPEMIFPEPCAIHSLFPFPLVSVSSSTKFIVIKVSINPTEAAKKAGNAINCSVSKLKGKFCHNSIFGVGNSPFKPVPPPSII